MSAHYSLPSLGESVLVQRLKGWNSACHPLAARHLLPGSFDTLLWTEQVLLRRPLPSQQSTSCSGALCPADLESTAGQWRRESRCCTIMMHGMVRYSQICQSCKLHSTGSELTLVFGPHRRGKSCLESTRKVVAGKLWPLSFRCSPLWLAPCRNNNRGGL